MIHYPRGSTIKPTSARAVDKGKGKVVAVEEGDDEEGDEDDGEDEEMDEEDDDDVSRVQMPEPPHPTKSSLQEEDDMEEIDPTAIVGRRTRGRKVDYTSTEALRKADLKPEDDAEDEGEDSFAHD
jgi:hypothetical protein